MQFQCSESIRVANLEFYHSGESDYIPTDDNKLADLLSRGEFEEFLLLAKKLGYKVIHWIDVRRRGVPIHLEELIERLICLQ